MDEKPAITYEEPRVTDFGGLAELTASTHLLYGRTSAVEHDLSFSSGSGPGAGGAPGGFSSSGSGASPAGGASDPVGQGGSGSAGSGAGGHGGSLPFTGFPVAVAAAAGSVLAASGAALRRWTGRPRRR